MNRFIATIPVALALAAATSASQAPRPAVPTPESVIGWAPCADYKLATYEQIADYIRKLDAASDRMQAVEIGKTAEGRTHLMAVISSEENIKNLTRYKDIARKLALARGLTDDEAQALAREGKTIVWIDYGLHSTEVAHGQTAPWMAYKAVSEESAEMRFIRDNVIFLLVPNMNPDGTTLVAKWYMEGRPWSTNPPELYHKYVGHDNYRDWFMFNMPETQNVGRQLYTEWFPQIVYNQHQTGPFPARIFIPPFEDPMNPNIPPLVMRGIAEVGSAMSRRFAREGKPGVISRLNYDTWWNGGMRTGPYYHNMVGILTETQHNSPQPMVYDPKTFPKTFADGTSTQEPSTFYPMPFRGGEWHLRNSCEYMVTASMAVLDIGAKRREEWLYDIYQMGRDAIRAGDRETYVVSADQWDAGAAVKLVNVLRWGAVEVERATQPFTAGGVGYPAGSYLVRGAQPFRAHLTDLLNPQVYPDRRIYPGGPPERPYDITGWTLPYQMGVRVNKVGEAVTAATEKVEWAKPDAGFVAAQGRFGYLIDPRTNDAYIAVNRLLKGGERVFRLTAPVAAAGMSLPAGAFAVAAAATTQARVGEAARSLGLKIAALDSAPGGEALRLKAPRIGLYHAWGGNMDEGWTRWLFEQFEFPYTSLYDKDIRAGALRTKFDVIVLPEATYLSMLKGLEPGTMPEQYVGGMTPTGVANVYEFVRDGGTLIAMDHASELPLATFGLPIRDVTAGLRESEYYVPGTLLRIKLNTSHPVAYGMQDETAAFLDASPAFAVGWPRRGFFGAAQEEPRLPEGVSIVAQYPTKDLLMSGWILGDGVLAGRAAVIEASVGKGRVVLLGFRTQHRGQPHATFKLLFNSVLLGGAERAPLVRATEP
ncbi:MAG: peptidase M14 [Acidobacteria bacterium]|nr:peptidase M14 [Acidobacteriota bacterium]